VSCRHARPAVHGRILDHAPTQQLTQTRSLGARGHALHAWHRERRERGLTRRVLIERSARALVLPACCVPPRIRARLQTPGSLQVWCIQVAPRRASRAFYCTNQAANEAINTPAFLSICFVFRFKTSRVLYANIFRIIKSSDESTTCSTACVPFVARTNRGS
jgi:hypothetical protein